SVTGLENAHVLRPGYAVEYDFFPPYQINLNMETKYVEGLFFAGQINGTSGYEEAAAQGMMAGINAALKVKQKDPFILRRNEAYIGVLIDDLVNKSTLEPYRIFTSLAEYRLLLRQDNADMRLMEKGNAFGLIDEKQMEKFIRKKDAINQIETWIEKTNLHPKKINSFLINKGSTILEEPEPLAKILKRPEVTLTDLLECEEEIFEPKIVNLLKYRDTLREVDTSIKYDGYLKRQQEQVDRFLRMENKKIPLNFDYDKITSLSKEAREKLKKVKPGNVGQASRISGVSPSDISLLLVFLERGSLGKNIQDSFNDTLN
nr:FAD-dependent oxidoreductase [bacterium]